ncbi:hypothetical protein C8R45DRAFT_965096 [Mycena sanguinolenta]|nr:hypothetical protein C8R45DRAFT_965096 [Mycena sanguinolenta]
MDWFCSGIIENPSRADSVRSFTVDERPYYNCVKIRSDLLLGALKLMLRLDHLSISGTTFDDRHWVILLEEANFPELVSCKLFIPSALDLSSTPPLHLLAGFFAHHSTLKRVEFHSWFEVITPQSVRIPLPNVEFFFRKRRLYPNDRRHWFEGGSTHLGIQARHHRQHHHCTQFHPKTGLFIRLFSQF